MAHSLFSYSEMPHTPLDSTCLPLLFPEAHQDKSVSELGSQDSHINPETQSAVSGKVEQASSQVFTKKRPIQTPKKISDAKREYNKLAAQASRDRQKQLMKELEDENLKQRETIATIQKLANKCWTDVHSLSDMAVEDHVKYTIALRQIAGLNQQIKELLS